MPLLEQTQFQAIAKTSAKHTGQYTLPGNANRAADTGVPDTDTLLS